MATPLNLASIVFSTARTLTKQAHGVESKGRLTTRLDFPVLNGIEDTTRFAIKTLSAADEVKAPASIRLGLWESLFWAPITVETETGQKTVLININSAIKRMHLLGFSKESVKTALKENTLISLLVQNRSNEIDDIVLNKLSTIEQRIPPLGGFRRDFQQALQYIETNRGLWIRNQRDFLHTLPDSSLSIEFNATNHRVFLKIRGLSINYDTLFLDYHIHDTLENYLSSQEINSIRDYILKNPSLLFNDNSRYFKKSYTKLARSLFIKKGRVFLLRNRKAKADPSIGFGHFKRVVFAVDLFTGEQVASASQRITDDVLSKIASNEIRILRALRHVPGMLTLIGAVKYRSLRTAEKIRLFTSYCNSGNLRQMIKLKNLSKENQRRIFNDTIRAIAALHKKKYIHCDIKPGNIFLNANDSGELSAILGDFGLTTPESDHETRHIKRGTPMYLSPEYLCIYKSEKKREVTYSDDIWSLGLTLYQLLVLDQNSPIPFKKPFTPKKCDDYIQSMLCTFPVFKHILNDPIRTPMDIVHLMLKVNPAHRITAAEALPHLDRLEWT